MKKRVLTALVLGTFTLGAPALAAAGEAPKDKKEDKGKKGDKKKDEEAKKEKKHEGW